VASIAPKKKIGPNEPTTIAVIFSQNLWNECEISPFDALCAVVAEVLTGRSFGEVAKNELHKLPQNIERIF
jgi:hypothetical protein